MNASSESITNKSKSSSTRTTTLYDLMAEINASSSGSELGNSKCDFMCLWEIVKTVRWRKK